MAAFNKINSYSLEQLKGTHQFGTHTFKSYLSNGTPVATNTIKTDIADITAANGYAGPSTLTVSTAAVSGTNNKASVDSDVTITATGAVGPFRHVVMYNDTPTTPLDPLIAWWDYGSSISLANTETFTEDFDQTNGVIQIA